ncbi:MAG: hypothetical protein QXX53_06450, partial [Archaeoglobaceae archaeon]
DVYVLQISKNCLYRKNRDTLKTGIERNKALQEELASRHCKNRDTLKTGIESQLPSSHPLSHCSCKNRDTLKTGIERSVFAPTANVAVPP